MAIAYLFHREAVGTIFIVRNKIDMFVLQKGRKGLLDIIFLNYQRFWKDPHGQKECTACCLTISQFLLYIITHRFIQH